MVSTIRTNKMHENRKKFAVVSQLMKSFNVIDVYQVI